ncbi:hypothetical protein OG21DRAFT_1485344 [Imleria badia]|nr:hypothetical protein OG21DRAFT_1485344 [Imleria badia]
MADRIPMHLHKAIMMGRSRIHQQGVAPVAETIIAAFLASYRFLVKAMYHKATHLKGVQSTYLFNAGWQESFPRLDASQSKEVDRACMFIREIGEQIIAPLLRNIEAEEQGRRLVSFERRFKDTNRLKRKVADRLRTVPGRTPAKALAAIADAVRFTLQYQERGYVTGVRKDMERLRDRGLVLVALRNTWSNDQYKGINTRWQEPTSGLLFEVQFHTQASFRARELTHEAYERIRSDTIEGTEMAILRAFQRHVNAMVPIPPGVVDIGECQ